jgi:cation diffusion facilitator CzcD-associated flavoprotein CzcO
MTKTDVTVVGAGPYGLSAAAYLRTIKGLEVRVFGEPMSFWERNMPKGMFLRSNWTATQIASPDGTLSLEAYQESTGEKFYVPVPLENFIRYVQWFQRRAVPDLDRRNVAHIESDGNGFRVTLADGESFRSSRVIIAVGIKSFTRRPAVFENLPRLLASHTLEIQDLSSFAGKYVVVIGSGQSALESAALIHEAGGRVEVFGRARRISWLGGWASKTLHHRLGTGVRKLLYAPTDVGPAGISQLCARPDIIKRLPRSLHDRIWKRAVRPAGARWLVSRLSDVPIRHRRNLSLACTVGERVKIRFDDGTDRTADHVLFGTGYRVDISQYKFLAPELLACIDTFNGYPLLGDGFETSVSGLHILGSPAAWSLGPLMQFVSGTAYAGRTLVRHISARGPKMIFSRGFEFASEAQAE